MNDRTDPRDDPGSAAEEDSPGARRRWLLGVALILLAMIVVPGVVYRITAPRPVAVTVAPLGPETPEALARVAEELGATLDAHPVLTRVPWDDGPPAGAELVLELEAGPTVRLSRSGGGELVWEGRVTPREGESLAAAVARTTASAVTSVR